MSILNKLYISPPTKNNNTDDKSKQYGYTNPGQRKDRVTLQQML